MTLTSPTFKIVTTWQRKSGIERDAVQNVWYYQGPSTNPAPADFGNWANNFTAFLGAIGNGLGRVMSTSVDDISVAYWLLPNTPGAIGAPKMELLTSNAIVGTGVTLPTEVAICMTLEADITGIPEQGPGGVRPAARRRNRKYIGPLDESWVSFTGVTEEPVPTQTRLDTLLSAYKTHMIDAMVTDGWVGVCFSQANWDAHPILRVWVDNAFDSQRRRGNDPTLKTALPV